MFDLTTHNDLSDTSSAENNGNNSSSGSSSRGNQHHRYSDVGGVGTSSRRNYNVDEKTIQKGREDLTDLAVWMSGLDATSRKLDDPHDLCDGRAFAELLHSIDNNFFTYAWLETMPDFISLENTIVKRSNIRKLWRKIADYITDQLHRELPTNSRWTDIDERLDGTEESELLVAVDLGMIVVTLAHIGPNAAQYVEHSRSMTGKYKSEMANVARILTLIMAEIPEVTSFLEVSSGHDPSDENEMNVSLHDTCSIHNTSSVLNGNGRRRTMSSSNQSILEAQIDTLRNEKDGLMKEVDRLTKALDMAQLNTSISSDSNDIAMLESLNEELRAKRREAEERVHELEAQLEQLRPIVQELTIENDVMRSSQKDLNSLKTELNTAQNEAEVWRTKAKELSVYEELAKKREKEVRELQGQNKSLYSRIEHHIKNSTIVEDNKETNKQLRAEIGTLKGMNEMLELQKDSKERLNLNLESQLIQLKERVKDLQDLNEDLTAERNELQEKLLFQEHVTPRSLHESMFEGGNLSFDFSEKKLPLEIENKRLCERIKELEALEPLQGEIILMKGRVGVLEEEALIAQKRKEDLERELAELQERCAKSQQHASGDVVELKVQLEKANVELERMRDVEARAETRLLDMENLLKKRNAEAELNENALHGAKKVIDELESRCRPVGEDKGTSVQQFKEMQSENEQLRRKVEKLEIELQNVTETLEQENRLITTAAHHLAYNRSMDDSSMSRRARAGADPSSSTADPSSSSPEGPPTLLETQKMSGALSWRSSSFVDTVRQRFPIAASLVILPLLVIVLWLCIEILKAWNAPPRA